MDLKTLFEEEQKAVENQQRETAAQQQLSSDATAKRIADEQEHLARLHDFLRKEATGLLSDHRISTHLSPRAEALPVWFLFDAIAKPGTSITPPLIYKEIQSAHRTGIGVTFAGQESPYLCLIRERPDKGRGVISWCLVDYELTKGYRLVYYDTKEQDTDIAVLKTKDFRAEEIGTDPQQASGELIKRLARDNLPFYFTGFMWNPLVAKNYEPRKGPWPIVIVIAVLLGVAVFALTRFV